MTPFGRQPEPEFWAEKERRWNECAPDWGGRDPLNDWRHDKRSLASWFHELVREPSEPRMCAYCDGSLREQSRETIDHCGRLRPRAKLDWPTRVNVRLTIQVFRLNDRHRCEERKRVIREMSNAWKRDATTLERDDVTLEERLAQGPYRFVARRCLMALRTLGP